MKTAAFAIVLFGTSLSLLAADDAASGLPRSTPEQQGVSSSAVLAFLEAADKQVDAMHSFMLVRHGQVVAEGWWSPYDAGTPHLLHSLSKSFTSTAVGLAIADGKLSLDDEVFKFFPEDAPAEPSDHLRAMRVRHLLTMSTGHQTEPSLRGTQEWKKTFLAQPVPHEPGSHFLYNTAATYMLSAIVQKVTGQTVFDYLRPRLFEPLGIEHETWGTSPEGITLGGFGLSVRTEDVARFGQLYLQKGEWQGKQLVPASWVEAATSKQVSNGSNPQSDWNQGYGYQFWRCRHGIYRGDGAFGQFCVVMPELDAVVAITAGTHDMQGVLNLVWDKLLPGLQEEPLPADPESHEKLRRALASLTMQSPEGSGTPDVKWAGRKFLFAENEQGIKSASLESASDGSVTLVLRGNRLDQRVACGKGTWTKGRLSYAGQPEQSVAASGAWVSGDIYVAKMCFYETPAVVTATLRFAGDQLLLNFENHASFGPRNPPQLVGTAGGSEVQTTKPSDTIVGSWQAEFDTQIGVQKYVFSFKREGEKLTGRANSEISGEKREVVLQDIKLDGMTISFFEQLEFQGNDLRIDYEGKVAGDEIRFTRNVADFVTEELVAKRVKPATGEPSNRPSRPRRGEPIELGPEGKAAFHKDLPNDGLRAYHDLVL